MKRGDLYLLRHPRGGDPRKQRVGGAQRSCAIFEMTHESQIFDAPARPYSEVLLAGFSVPGQST
jgi:hypothetical protein